MGLFNSLIKVSKSVIKTPIAVVKDTVTLGGTITNEKAQTPKELKKLIKRLI